MKAEDSNMKFRAGTRVIVDNPNLQLHGRCGVIVRHCSVSAVVVQFDDKSAFRILKSNLIAGDSLKPVEEIITPVDERKILLVACFDWTQERDAVFDVKTADEMIRLLAERESVLHPYMMTEMHFRKFVESDLLASWDIVAGLFDGKPFTATHSVVINFTNP